MVSVTDAQAMVDLYTKAEMKVLKNQSVSIGDKTMTRANLPEIRAGRQEWEVKLRAIKAGSEGGSSMFSVVDFRS